MATRLRGRLWSGYEPPTLEAATRLSSYPWLVVGATCISGFIRQPVLWVLVGFTVVVAVAALLRGPTARPQTRR